jgi:hypothetical protein
MPNGVITLSTGTIFSSLSDPSATGVYWGVTAVGLPLAPLDVGPPVLHMLLLGCFTLTQQEWHYCEPPYCLVVAELACVSHANFMALGVVMGEEYLKV